MSLWPPQSLFGRMIWVLLTGLIVVQVLSMVIHRHERSQMVARFNSVQVSQRIADLVNVLDAADPVARNGIVDIFRGPDFLVRLAEKPVDRAPEAGGKQHTAEFLRSAVVDRLGGQRSIRIIPHRDLRETFRVQVGLHAGQWVIIQARLPSASMTWPSRMVSQLLILVVSVLGLSLIAVRWVTIPLQRLSNAAEGLGVDIHRPPLNEQGPVEVRRAAHAFNTMQARLIRYVQDRTRLLAAVSHDLKTPVTRLRLRTELLDDPKLRAKFEKDLDEMESMIIATLDFMRGADDAEPTQPVDLMALLESLQADAQEVHGEVSIEGTTHRPYSGKPMALKRCLGNLIDNALKYGDRARILVEDAPAQITVRIQDRGCGVPEDKLEQVFEPFYRLEESRSRDSGGTGLGLSIARNIAQAHNGRLVVKNLPGGGLEAILILPRNEDCLMGGSCRRGADGKGSQ